MKKLGLLFKEISENWIKNHLKESDSIFILKYSKISSPNFNILRQSLKNVDSTLFVVKNSVAKRALRNFKLDTLEKTITGPSGLVFVRGDPVYACRILCDFSREHENLRLEGAILKDKILNRKDIEALWRLPSREVLRLQTTIALKSLLSRLAWSLNHTFKKLVYSLEQIKNKREKVN